MFNSLDNLTIIVPSEWMEGIVKESFMSRYPVEVVNNGINLGKFVYREPLDRLYEKYGIGRDKKIILGVASIWDARKGMEDFLSLANILSDEYQIVLVGLSKRQMCKLPDNVIGILRTENQEELVMLYSLSHVFMNPSLEESFSLVTAEAIACGTPVIVLNTSAVKELVCQNNGIVLSGHDAADYLQAITELEERHLARETVKETARKYDVDIFTQKVINLYEQM